MIKRLVKFYLKFNDLEELEKATKNEVILAIFITIVASLLFSFSLVLIWTDSVYFIDFNYKLFQTPYRLFSKFMYSITCFLFWGLLMTQAMAIKNKYADLSKN